MPTPSYFDQDTILVESLTSCPWEEDPIALASSIVWKRPEWNEALVMCLYTMYTPTQLIICQQYLVQITTSFILPVCVCILTLVHIV